MVADICFVRIKCIVRSIGVHQKSTKINLKTLNFLIFIKMKYSVLLGAASAAGLRGSKYRFHHL